MAPFDSAQEDNDGELSYRSRDVATWIYNIF